MGGNNEFFENFERNKYLKKLPSMQRDKDWCSRTYRDFITGGCGRVSALPLQLDGWHLVFFLI